jgi:hypothetical protein
MSTDALPELLDRKALAETLGCCPRSCLDAIFQALPTVHLPGLRKTFVRRSDVAALLAESTYPPGERVRL